MKRILVATDLSSRSELAVMRAAALAKARNAELTVLNVLDDDQPPVLIAPQRLAIANLLEVNGQALKERLGVESKAIVRVGDPVVVINAVAEEIGADLLVMGAHRHTPLRDLFIGTTLERVVRNAKIPVLRAAGAPEEEYRRVLLALDFSPTSTRAVQMAGQLGFLDAASLTALHAFEPFAKGMMALFGIKEDRVEHYVDQEETQGQRRAARLRRRPGAGPRGHPVARRRRLADQRDHDRGTPPGAAVDGARHPGPDRLPPRADRQRGRGGPRRPAM
ncbi:universal stress protein [Pseudomonas aeruginosa]|nr:universal stress protein [Pseudomonas aeruginosa]